MVIKIKNLQNILSNQTHKNYYSQDQSGYLAKELWGLKLDDKGIALKKLNLYHVILKVNFPYLTDLGLRQKFASGLEWLFVEVTYKNFNLIIFS